MLRDSPADLRPDWNSRIRMITTKIRAAVELLENGDRAYAAGDICTAELLHESADDYMLYCS